MVVFKCDICGEMFTYKKGFNRISFDNVLYDTLGSTIDEPAASYHACPNCMEAVYSFIEQRSQKDRFDTKF